MDGPNRISLHLGTTFTPQMAMSEKIPAVQLIWLELACQRQLLLVTPLL